MYIQSKRTKRIRFISLIISAKPNYEHNDRIVRKFPREEICRIFRNSLMCSYAPQST